MLKVAIIGFGRWGPNLARNFQNSRNFEIKYIVDKSNKNLSKAMSIYPLADYYNDYKKIKNNKIDLVIIATPTKFHFEIANYFTLNFTPRFLEDELEDQKGSAPKLCPKPHSLPYAIGFFPSLCRACSH